MIKNAEKLLNYNPQELIDQYGSPLYVYDEAALRERCREMTGLVDFPNFRVNYSTKANSNLELLRIIQSEGLDVDAMSPGEIHVLLAAGFKPQQIFYIGNNVSTDEMRFAIDRGITVSVDSLAQLELFGRINRGGEVAVRFNPGVGTGHHEKVVTGGKKTKFGVGWDKIDEVKSTLKQYALKLIGINQHIGSLFLDGRPYLDGVKNLLEIAAEFDGLQFIDCGGGFGIPYHKEKGENRLELKELGVELSLMMSGWSRKYHEKINFKIEPGRYIVAESGVLLGTVHAIKENSGITYIGTDLGFNVLARPVMYDSHHDLEIYRQGIRVVTDDLQPATVVGNICETGDIIAKGRELPNTEAGDILCVKDAGAYGYVMSSNYNNRLRPAEVLITTEGNPRLIRRRETFDDLMRCFDVR